MTIPSHNDEVGFPAFCLGDQRGRDVAVAALDAMQDDIDADDVRIEVTGSVARQFESQIVALVLNPIPLAGPIARLTSLSSAMSPASRAFSNRFTSATTPVRPSSRLREWLLGGVTYNLMHESPVPILIAH
jgi:hypothetical protein